MFKCEHSEDVLFEVEYYGRRCQGHCHRAKKKLVYAQPMEEPCIDCQHNYAWIQVPYEYGWRWVAVTAWLMEPTNHDLDEGRRQQRRRRRRRDRPPTPEPSPTEEEMWEEWRNDEEPYLEENDDPPPPYSP